MREMKDSGNMWIGATPETWKMIPLKYLASYNDEVLSENTDDKFEFDYIEIGSVQYGRGIIYTEHMKFKNAPSRARRIVRKDDIIVSTVRTYLKAVATIPACNNSLIASTGFIVIRPHKVLPRFMNYALLSESFISLVESHSTGISYPAINSVDVVKFKIPVPCRSEQERIAAFLDAECAEIDAVLEKTRASIEEYKKLKQAVITQAVTKGIRGDRPMKDSGIEWIGTCPLNWTVCRIKNVIFPQEKEVLPDDEIITCFRDGEVTLRKNRREDGFTVSFTEHGYHGVDKGDLVIHGMDAFAGAIGCSDSRGKTTPVVHTCKTAGNNRFFMYFLRSMAYGNILMDLSNGVRIRSSDFRNFAKLGVFGAVMPPLEEQNEIVDYIDGIVIQMDRLIQKKENLLTEIENYKKSLIYEYVTGKKEVV